MNTVAGPQLPVPHNPFRPGAGQRPIYLAGRTKEQDQFKRILEQSPVMQNTIVTGLRGVGKTVLLETLKPLGPQFNWLWTGNDLSESVSLTEERVAQRLVVDLSTLLSPLVTQNNNRPAVGFTATISNDVRPLNFNDLWEIYQNTPGLIIDKLKAVFAHVYGIIRSAPVRGIIFAYDEAQNMSDHASANEFPLSLLLDLFSYLQRTYIDKSFMLVLTGLPTLFPRLNEARTYTERMFHVMHLERLAEKDAHDAVVQPLEITQSTLKFADKTIKTIIDMSGGYPYFIQFICREVFDAWIGKIKVGNAPSVPMNDILAKLDLDFFAPRWQRSTDRQQQFMQVIATLDTADEEFTVPEIVEASRRILSKGFTPSHAIQILQALSEKGLIYRSKRGGYCFAVPLLDRFIRRQPFDPASLRSESTLPV